MMLEFLGSKILNYYYCYSSKYVLMKHYNEMEDLLFLPMGGGGFVRFMVFNNISAISQQEVLLVEETRVPGENHQTATSHLQTLSPNVLSTPRLGEIRR